MRQECYEFIKGPNNKVSIVGFGSYGEVKLAKNTQTGQMVAIKLMYGRNAKDQIDVHHKLSHPNIIKLLNYNYDKEKNVTYMVLEYAEAGTLHNKIKFGYGQLPKDKVKRYFRDVCKGVQYLHSLKYMHRDIKPQNILLTKDDHAKLCDFGFAAILEFRSTLCGTYEYMAPEMIQEKPYDYKVDIWALGILLFQLIQGTAPFRGENGQDVINEMKKPIVFSNRFEKQEIQLVKKILRVNAENRPNVTAILQHPYLAEYKQVHDDKQQKITNYGAGKGGPNLTSQNQKNEPKVILKYQHMQETEKQDKPMPRQETKQFKHYVPQGIKPNNMNNVGKSTNIHLPSSISSHPTYQSTSSYSPLNTSTQSNPADSSFKQQDKSIPSFLSNQKQPTSIPSKVVNNSYGYQSMGTLNPQNRPNIPNMPISVSANNVPQQILQNPAVFKKH